jgi:acetoin utilization deacetylase AcuC-like enzyme
VPTVWDERYCTPAAHTNSTIKQLGVVRAAVAEGLLDIRSVPFEESATWGLIGAVHAPEYVAAVRTGRPRSLAESQGFIWSPAFAESVARIWNGHIAACRLALAERVAFHPVSGAHHARRETGAGFCTFNFLAGAGKRLLDEGAVARVMVVDLDAHQGDGTYHLVRGDPRFALFDIAGTDWIGSFETERLFYRVARTAAEYRALLQNLPAALDAFRPQLVQYQAGMDCHEHDPIGGIRGVDAALLSDRDRLVVDQVVSRGIPLVINLAGGYQPGGVSERLHVQTARLAAERRANQSRGSTAAM